MSFLLGDNVRKDIDYKHEFKTERWMKTDCFDQVEKYHRLRYGGYVDENITDEGIDDDETSKNC